MSLTFCIIDDDLVSQFATRYCIQQFYPDAKINTCESGEEGLSFCAEFFKENGMLPDIILLDLVMKGMDGWHFLEELLNIYGKQKLPRTYVLSAFSKSNHRVMAKTHKLISGYMDKPLSRVHLERILEEMTSGK